jgi:hypothetical protein
VAHWKAIDGLYLTYQVSSTPKDYSISSSLPKSAKSNFGSLGCLGVNFAEAIKLDMTGSHLCCLTGAKDFPKPVQYSFSLNNHNL